MSVAPEDQPELAETQDESVGEAFARFVDSGKDYARSEIDRQKIRASIVGSGVRDAAILFAIAFILLFAALVALLVGLIFTLAPLLTPAGATAAVIGGTLLIVILLALLGRSRISRMTKALRS